MAELYRYAAFVSYSSKDAAFAKRLHRALESYAIPTSLGRFDLTAGGKANRIYPIFRDREELAAGQLGDAIEANLRNSAALIVVCSPSAAASPWVQKEIEYFSSLGRSAKIFAVIANSAPVLDSEGNDGTPACFPPAFRGDALRGDKFEPLAADARKLKDGFRNAWLKLVAGIIGVTPGQIIDRDKRLRRRRAIASFAALALPALFVAGVWSNWDRIWPEYLRLTRYSPHVVQNAAIDSMAAGQVFRECDTNDDCPQMVILPSGSFMMGSPDDDSQAMPNERPLHRVDMRRLAVSKYEITFAQWRACAEGGGCRGQRDPSDEGWGRGERPVINVSLDDAHEYVAWLSRMTGARYRLLSEAEWEYTARGSATLSATHHEFSWGDAWPVCDRTAANGAAAAACPDQRTQPVGSFRPNPFGVYDMAGNVREWVEDCFHTSYDLAPGDGSPWMTGSCTQHLQRGGDWAILEGFLRSATRFEELATDRSSSAGFRVAREISSAPIHSQDRGRSVQIATARLAEEASDCTRDLANTASAQTRIVACSRAIQSDLYKGGHLSNMYAARGWSRHELHQDDQAVDDLGLAVLFNQRNGVAFYYRGAIRLEASNYGEAIADFDLAIAAQPNEPVFFNARCFARAELGRELDLALRDCGAALTLSPNDPSTLDSRGLVHLRRGEFGAAADDYDRAFRGDGTLMRSLYGRGLARQRLGQTGKGQADVARALERDPALAREFAGYGLSP